MQLEPELEMMAAAFAILVERIVMYHNTLKASMKWETSEAYLKGLARWGWILFWYLLLFHRYCSFCVTQIRKSMASLSGYNIETIKSQNQGYLRRESVKGSWNLAPVYCLMKSTRQYVWRCCHGNTFGNGPFLLCSKYYPHLGFYTEKEMALFKTYTISILR